MFAGPEDTGWCGFLWTAATLTLRRVRLAVARAPKMSSEKSIIHSLDLIVEATRLRAAAQGLRFFESRSEPASIGALISAQEKLQRSFAPDHHALLSLCNGVVLGTSLPGQPATRRVFRIFSCEEAVDETAYFRNECYNLRQAYVVGSWDGIGSRFIVLSTDNGPANVVIDVSPDDPSSFGLPFDFSDIEAWLLAEIPRLCD
jgi:hypothetical protein